MSDVYAALLDVQRNLPRVGKGATADTGKFSYDYATLPAVHAALLPVLHDHDLLWTVTVEDRQVLGKLTYVGESSMTSVHTIET